MARLPWSPVVPVAPWPRPTRNPRPLLGDTGSDVADLVCRISALISCIDGHTRLIDSAPKPMPRAHLPVMTFQTLTHLRVWQGEHVPWTPRLWRFQITIPASSASVSTVTMQVRRSESLAGVRRGPVGPVWCSGRRRTARVREGRTSACL